MFICLNGVDVVNDYSEPKDLDNISFTMRGRDRTLETIAALGNQATDDSMILDAMRSELKTIPFGDYLKRYIYMNSGMTGDFREMPVVHKTVFSKMISMGSRTGLVSE